MHLLHQTTAHCDGDTIVHFRGSDVISTGDILSTVSYPTFDVARGGSINGVIDGLNDLLDLVIAEYQTEGGTLMIPGTAGSAMPPIWRPTGMPSRSSAIACRT